MAAVRGRDFLLMNRAYGSVFGECAPNALLFRLRDQLVAEDGIGDADEGFGSLDEQSREQAVQMLQRLSYGNRLVGIISHVSELKESIDKKIIVKKGSAGSSIAWQE